ncbi:MAG TPA: DedA family protein [Tepidisphaeraceae bacterium]|nr:DedA family protein [Tepidisphaeraceae bacterium]
MELLAWLDVTQIENWMEAGGYLLLFGLLLSCGLGVPIPEDIPLTLAGFFVAQGKMHLALASVAAWCGIIGGDCILYNLGRKYGLNIIKVPLIGKHVTHQRIERAELLFERYGVWVVAIGRLFAGIRGAMVVAAGTIRFNFVKFIIADGLAALVSGGAFIALGYWGGITVGDPKQFMEQTVAPYKHWFFTGLVVVVVLVVLYIWWRRKRHQAISDVAIEKVARQAKPTPTLQEVVPECPLAKSK